MKSKLLLIFIITIFIISLIFISTNKQQFTRFVSKQIRSPLTQIDSLPDTTFDALYILGGAPYASKFHYKKAASLYKSYSIKKVIILYSPGKNRYDPEKGRNLTNLEWSVKQLTNLGIDSQLIDTISTNNEKSFGTYNEALAFAKKVRENKYKNVIIVSSIEHTKRIHFAFSKALRKTNCTFYIAASKHHLPRKEIPIEFVKFTFYKLMLFKNL